MKNPVDLRPDTEIAHMQRNREQQGSGISLSGLSLTSSLPGRRGEVLTVGRDG